MQKIPPQKIAYNNQIELRLMSPRDAKSIYQGMMASLPELRRFMSWAHYKTDLAQACATYARFEAKSLAGEEVSFAGFDANTGAFLCCCSLVPASRLNPRAYEIGYWVASPHTRMGYGTIAAKTLTALAFRHYQAERVCITCNPNNNLSIKIIDKCGFQFEGRFRNYFMQPTPKMLAAGYSPVTDALSFSLIPDDLPSLAWFDEFCAKLCITEYHTANDMKG